MKSIEIELNLPLVDHNNISKFSLIWSSQTQVFDRKPLKFYNFVIHKGTELQNVKSEIGQNRTKHAVSGS